MQEPETVKEDPRDQELYLYAPGCAISRKEIRELTLSEAMAKISNVVYDACALFELLEHRKVFGNGHHMRQKVAQFAQSLMYYRWDDEKERENTPVHSGELVRVD